MTRKIVRIALFLFIAYIPIKFVCDQFAIRNTLAPIIKKFELTCAEHEKTGKPFSGAIDKIVAERNQSLRNNKFIIMGNWSTEAFLYTEPTIYLNSSWFPADVYNMLAKATNEKNGNALEALFTILFLLIPAVIYTFLIVYYRMNFSKPATKS